MLSVLALAVFAATTAAQNRTPAFGTHDNTVSGFGQALWETWTDIKTPGDGFKYVAGTIEVRSTTPGALFSQQAILQEPPNFNPVSITSLSIRKQVVCLQCRDASETIVWQKFFYGLTPNLTGDANIRATNVRGIAVWPGDPGAGPQAQAIATRIAICGETYEEQLPLSQSTTGWTQATANDPSGFIAVFDGTGSLLWTHHLFAANSPTQPSLPDCAVTDVCIRREGLGESPVDVVTYCGISSHGDPAGTTSVLEPFRAFATPITGTSSGSTNHGTGQWDGIIGRLSHPDGGTTNIDFHSIVGGPGQDGMFGIAEVDDNLFVVVGSTTLGGTLPFPFQTMPLGSSTAVAMLATFNALPTRSGGLLGFKGSMLVGGIGEDRHTVARDVLVGHYGFAPYVSLTIPPWAPLPGVGLHTLSVVGSTDNSDLWAEFVFAPQEDANNPGPTNPLNLGYLRGPTDGWIGVFADTPDAAPFDPLPLTAAYVGSDHEDGLTGVQGWNEFAESSGVVGFTQREVNGQPADFDIIAQSFFFDTAWDWVLPPLQTPPAAPNVPPYFLRQIRTTQQGGDLNDLPTGMGQRNALDGTAATVWNQFGLGDPAGGGIAVDQIARVNFVGTTSSDPSLGVGYPVFGTGIGPDLLPDAVRTVIDMLPAQSGRTDGGGDPLPGGLPTGYTGGTTPACALAPYGIRIGGVSPGLHFPDVQRMLIDYEGLAPGLGGSIVAASLIVSRPPYQPGNLAPSFVLPAVQFGLPNNPSPPLIAPGNVEVWMTNGPLIFVSVMNPTQSVRIPLGDLTSGQAVIQPGWDLTAQMVCLVLVPTPGITCAAGEFTDFVASPAIWIRN